MAQSDVEQVSPDEPVLDVTEEHRDAWLEIAAADVDSGLAALATAARGGRTTPAKS
jgi:hypothetical protein